MPSIIQAYFATIEVYDGQSDQTPTQTEINNMIAFLSGDLPVNVAASSLTLRTTQSPSMMTMKSRKSFLWYFINEIAVHLPLLQPQIVDLLQTIRVLELLGTVPGEGFNNFCTEHTWSKLEGWVNKWADSINSILPSNHFICS